VETPPAVVLAIGGSASVGKTTLAAEIARQWGSARVVHVDDLRDTVERGDLDLVDPTPEVWTRPPAQLTDALIAFTERLHPVIASEIDGLLGSGVGGIVEGEGVEPRLVHRWSTDQVRAVHVVERDADRLRATFSQRPSSARFLALAPATQDAVTEMNVRYGAWLQRESERHGQVWLPAHPWCDLPDRVLDAIGTVDARR
jgi:cytidylate kinase